MTNLLRNENKFWVLEIKEREFGMQNVIADFIPINLIKAINFRILLR